MIDVTLDARRPEYIIANAICKCYNECSVCPIHDQVAVQNRRDCVDVLAHRIVRDGIVIRIPPRREKTNG